MEKKNLNGGKVWTMTSKDYIKAIIQNLEERLKKKGIKFPIKNVNVPISASYVPETDQSEELKTDDITMFQELIGELRWAIEIGRVDILTENVNALSLPSITSPWTSRTGDSYLCIFEKEKQTHPLF